MLYGHRSLADCHRSQHSAACATCLEEAVMAGEVIAEHGGVDDAAAIAAEVKSRFRAAIVRNKLQAADLPALRSDGGRAYLAACSECHQPPHPGMYAASDWRQSLSRMEAYLDQSAVVQINEQVWNAAVEYIRETAATFPPESGERYRQSIAQAVEHLVITEGESANYPSNQDPILGPEWFDRMVKAYRLAREIPAAQLADLADDGPCRCRVDMGVDNEDVLIVDDHDGITINRAGKRFSPHVDVDAVAQCLPRVFGKDLLGGPHLREQEERGDRGECLPHTRVPCGYEFIRLFAEGAILGAACPSGS
jgi:mono/diheme cytochrome c family protein